MIRRKWDSYKIMSVTSSILRATDGKLRADNWQYILEVCDRVREDPEDGGEEAIEVIEERLEQKDANVILRTLSLILSLAENCGSRLKQLVSSKRFTQKLQLLIESRSVHITVKREVAKVVKQLAKSFEDDPSLRYMGDLLSQISSKHPHLLVSDQPSVPSKKEMSAESKLREEKDLEEALKLSLVEYEQQKQILQDRQRCGVQSSAQGDSNVRNSADEPDQPPTPSVVKKVRAMYDLSSSEPDELSFKKGDVIVVLEQVYRDWWRGTLYGKVGIFPLNYVAPVKEPTQRELELERQNERALLSQKTNVDQLYYTLQRSKDSSGGDFTQDPTINDLYGSVTPLRPQIAKSIGKYARKREDLASLRQVLANAEATYNQLLDRATNAYTSPLPPQSYSQPAAVGDQRSPYPIFPPEPTRGSYGGDGQNRYIQGPQNYTQPQGYTNYGRQANSPQLQGMNQVRYDGNPASGQFQGQNAPPYQHND